MKFTILAIMITTSFAGVASDTVSSQEEAIRICTEKGMRLPTAREFAVIASALGGKVSEKHIAGHTFVNSEDPFYYSNENYKNSISDFKGCYWTSSLNDKHPLPYHDYYISFDADAGSFNDHVNTYRHAANYCQVKCL